MDNTPLPKKLSINRIFLIYMTLVGCLSIFSLGYLWISSEWTSFEKEADDLRVTYLEGHKKTLEREVTQALDFVKYMQSQTEERLKASIQSRVYEAYFVAENIYNTHQDADNDEQIGNLIKDALRPIRFNKGRGYYFAFNLDGIETLFAANPEMEGQNMLPVKGGQGEFVVAEMLALVSESGQGFYEYTWPKPNQEGFFPKIAFVKLFKPIGWVIGTGEYLDDVEMDIQHECLRWISNIKLSKGGRVFVGQWDGVSLLGPDAGKNILDVKDPNGVNIVRELVQAAKSGGGFIRYVLPNPENTIPPSRDIPGHVPMISYAVGVPEWQWYIGAETGLSEIEQTIASKNAELERNIRKHIRNVFFVIAILLIFIFFVVQFLSNRIRNNLNLFTRFFSRASSDAIRIDQGQLHFSEFARLAESANRMVDKQRQAETALRESEEKYRTLFKFSNIGILLIKDVIFDCNEAACKIFMYDKAEIIGKAPEAFSAPEDCDGNAPAGGRNNIWKPHYDTEPNLFEWQCLRKDGAVAELEISLKAVSIGDETFLLATARDITEFKCAKKRMAESEERLRTLIENSPDAFIVHDLEGSILQVNEQVCKNLGYSRDELIGMNVMDINTGESWEKAAEMRDQTAKGPVTSYEGEYRRKDGSRYPVDVKMSSIRFDDETLLFGFIRDISERKELDKEKEKYQHQLMHAQKMEAIGTLAGGIAHDFNNLLMGIQGCASLMSLDLEPSHPDMKHVTAIMDYTMKATNLTKQLLGVARGGKYEVKPMNLNQVVAESSVMFGRTRKEIRIHTDLREPAPVVAADRRQLEQVLLNLYINAGQAMPEGGELFLETSIVDLDAAFCQPHSVNPGRYAKIVIRDTGIGMDDTIRQRIFDPFFTTKDKGRGTGLGLASVYGIIKNHAGIVMVTSEISRGATFTIYLPLSKRRVKKEKPAVEGMTKGTETILMIDDENMVIEVGQLMLEKLGYQVIAVDNGEKAITAFQENFDGIDMVLLDMIMPGMDGGKTFDRIREIKPDIPVLLSSGYALNGQAEKIMQRGCNGFIQKPFHITELSQKIRKILDSETPTVLEKENHQAP
jgi:PAS domain S-box-containing protein